MMNRRHMVGLLILGPVFAGAARAQGLLVTPQDVADIASVEAYLRALPPLKARFLQVAPDGSQSGGTAWLQRPGRMRFEYDPPSPLLLVAGNGLLVFHDAELQQTTNLPLSTTPLGLLLQENLKLSGDVTVTGINRQPGELQITLVRTASPGEGSLTLIFADNPLALRSWWIIDQQRRETQVSLFNVELGGTFDQKLFAFIDPRFFNHQR